MAPPPVGANVSLPGRSFGPVAARTALPPTNELVHAFPGRLPPPLRKLMRFRSTVSPGGVSSPVLSPLPAKLSAGPWPGQPVTAIWPFYVPFAAPVPNAPRPSP
ncbi:MAG: hypothetical protein ACKODX_05630 [Gemmata sp.]